MYIITLRECQVVFQCGYEIYHYQSIHALTKARIMLTFVHLGIKYLIVFLITIFLFSAEVNHYFVFIGHSYFLSCDRLFMSFNHFSVWLLFSSSVFKNSIYEDTNPFSFIFVKSTFSQFVVCLVALGLNSNGFHFHRVIPNNSMLPPHMKMALLNYSLLVIQINTNFFLYSARYM